MSPLTDEQRALFSLTLVSGLGPRLIDTLLQQFGSAVEAVRANVNQLQQVPHIGERSAPQFRDALDKMDVEAELQRLRQHNVHLLFRNEDNYPSLLSKIAVPPRLLYVRGTIQDDDDKAIAIVGSRRCTSYGKRIAERLAGDLARAGWTIVSGLARGIDGAAHHGALQSGGRTIAVLAGGLSSIYPPEHADLAVQVEASGALITESHMQMESLAVLFPPRNRIISGLARAVVVVEASRTSGAVVHTAKHALEQDRQVFAVPGQVDSPNSEGTLQLLRNGAGLARHADDILEDLRGIVVTPRHSAANVQADATPSLAKEKQPPPDLDETSQRIWQFLADAPRHQDEMVQELSIPVSELSGMLLLLEMKKAIRRLPGNRYEQC